MIYGWPSYLKLPSSRLGVEILLLRVPLAWFPRDLALAVFLRRTTLGSFDPVARSCGAAPAGSPSGGWGGAAALAWLLTRVLNT